MNAAQGRGGRAHQPRPLRVASHNMGGLRVTERRAAARLEAAVQLWAELELDVVCLQETHQIDERDLALLQYALRSATERRHQPGWTVAAHSGSSAGRQTAGVAILIRANLAPPAATTAIPLPAGVPSGWFTACNLMWGGHKMQICSVYFPQASRPDASTLRRQLCETCLAPMASAAAADGTLLLWCGDYNFVDNPGLDSTAGPTGRTGDAAPAQLFQAAATAATMVDSFRMLHPQRRDFTHMYRAPHAGGSRLDRIYLPEAAGPFIARASVHVASPSDHRLALLRLAPRPQPPRQKVPRRLRLHLLTHPDLKRTMGDWLTEQVASAPRGADHPPQTMLDWWPAFKRRLTAQVVGLNRVAVTRRTRPAATVQQLTTAAQEAAAALDASPHDVAQLAEAVAAQVAVQKGMRAAAGAEVLAARRAWISDGERPSPTLTALIQETSDGGGGPGPSTLRDSTTGQLVSDPARIPQIIANYWRDVSAVPREAELPETVKQQARAQVLEALRAHPKRMPAAADADSDVGRAQVTSAEVTAALKATPRGKAPGWDGLPAELYRAFHLQLSPLLADVYTAIGTTGRMPTRFTDGIIKVLYKKGDPTQPGNYRPITLLNTDYRTLAKVLATRLGPALDAAISQEQTAFLPGRLIGCNIFALRHLPHLLRSQGRAAIIAFLDFAKAYDTVHRDFLLAAMAELGASEQLCKWVQTLLSDTQAQAMVGARLSQPVTMAAGVRQGCPLAPLLYLYVAQALLSWLQQRGVGIRLDPESEERTTAVQFADDGQTLLEGEAAIPSFLAAMQTFAEAAGQKLNMDKVELVRVGLVPATAPPPPPPPQQEPPQQLAQPSPQHPSPPPPPPPQNIAGLRVVPAATALGIRFSNSPAMLQPSHWRAALQAAKQRMHRVTIIPLSAFGRCAAVSAYALQLNTYHWEHGGLPPGGVATQLEAWAAAAGDRRASPMQPCQRLTGVPRQLLYGRPSVGGFGLLPLTLHTRAREAVWAARLALSAGRTAAADGEDHPWAHITDLFLRQHHPLLSPSSVLTANAACGAGPHPGAAPLPDDIRRALHALSYLPPAQDVETDAIPAAGDWCFNTPLWGNPILPNSAAAGDAGEGAAAATGLDPDFVPEEEGEADAATESNTATPLPRRGLENRHKRLAACTALRTVGDAVRMGRAAAAAPHGAGWDQWVQTHLRPHGATSFRRRPTLDAIQHLLADISSDWRAAAAEVLDHPERAAGLDSEDTIRARLVGRVGWRLGASQIVKLRGLTVRIATHLQLQAGTERRARLHAAYEQEARVQQPQQPAAEAAAAPAAAAPTQKGCCVPGTLRRLWAIKWEREHKETLWRLAVDGVPLPGNTHLRGTPVEPCACGGFGGAAGQQQAPQCSPRAHHFWECPVAQAVIQQVTAYVPGTISRANVWLAEAPIGVQQCVWDVVSLAALAAMERARAGLRAVNRRAAPPTLGGDAQEPADALATPLEVAIARAVLDFWQRVQGFAELGVPRRGWDGVGPDHPILSVVDGRLLCVQPVGMGADGEEGGEGD